MRPPIITKSPSSTTATFLRSEKHTRRLSVAELIEEELAGDVDDPRDDPGRPNKCPEVAAAWCLLCLEIVAFLGVVLPPFLPLASLDGVLAAEPLFKDGSLKPAKLTMLLLYTSPHLLLA
mmetsp:Transcript_6595/g.16179  ORF Transcript_6595/g.16179 Transcript_6595/m.16179 type:complete len:120 (-) Transcript_6595:17-376(-)